MLYTFENLNVGQYQRLISLEENQDPIKVVEALTGKTKSQLTVKEIEAIKIGDMKPPEIVGLDKFFIIDGVAFGRVNMENLSYGEFVDLLEYAKDLNKNLIEVVSLMFRPITKFDTKGLVKTKMADFYIKKNKSKRALKILDGIEYEIEVYDPLKCDLRHNVVKRLPAAAAHWCITFFLNFLKQHEIDSLKFSEREKLKFLKQMQEKLKEITSKEE
jgi:hypothetical protein